MTADHAARAVELLNEAKGRAPGIRVQAGVGFAVLALAEAVANFRCGSAVNPNTGAPGVGVQRPRWDDDLRADHPAIVTERGQERPEAPETVGGTGAATAEPEQAHSEWTWVCRHPNGEACYTDDPVRDASEHERVLPRPVPDPTHTTPITVHGIPAEDHHAHVCPVCRRVRKEKP